MEDMLSVMPDLPLGMLFLKLAFTMVNNTCNVLFCDFFSVSRVTGKASSLFHPASPIPKSSLSENVPLPEVTVE